MKKESLTLTKDQDNLISPFTNIKKKKKKGKMYHHKHNVEKLQVIASFWNALNTKAA